MGKFGIMDFVNGLIFGASDAIFVADVSTGQIVYANPASGKLFECNYVNLIGKNFTDLHPKEELEEIQQKFASFTSNNNYKETTAHIITLTGSKKLVLITSAHSFLHDNKRYVTAYFKDITYVERLKEISFEQSHLVRRPLANILGISKMLMEGQEDSNEERLELISLLYTEANNLDDVVRSVNSKSKVPLFG